MIFIYRFVVFDSNAISQPLLIAFAYRAFVPRETMRSLVASHHVASHNINMLHRTILHCSIASLVLLRSNIVRRTMRYRIAALLLRRSRRGGEVPARGVCVCAVPTKTFYFFLLLLQHHFHLQSVLCKQLSILPKMKCNSCQRFGHPRSRMTH